MMKKVKKKGKWMIFMFWIGESWMKLGGRRRGWLVWNRITEFIFYF
ncbi:MAG: hypothetical protein UT14_C0028G0009 [Candidatus Shapirobacteria bacterium GW2011_GWE1_38_92]|uniref:Uncharacterized protein n=1 Tax=Candidatus Shapirobacteria bacterium GW2011_GWE1_38_92 TaxID=1618489 RepID=A0A0G0NYB4_9BACT|nr:MAG: hypothetical protein UT14_C0028G0009 [Candidatus Shapirobacteria bacterium GW2011_GWE1_38_92]